MASFITHIWTIFRHAGKLYYINLMFYCSVISSSCSTVILFCLTYVVKSSYCYIVHLSHHGIMLIYLTFVVFVLLVNLIFISCYIAALSYPLSFVLQLLILFIYNLVLQLDCSSFSSRYNDVNMMFIVCLC